MEGDPLARITPWRREGEGDAQDGASVHNSNPAINMPSAGASPAAGAPSKEGLQEPSQAAAGWGDMGEFSMAPLDAPAFSGTEQSQQPEQRQQHSRASRYDMSFPEPAERASDSIVGSAHCRCTVDGSRLSLLPAHDNTWVKPVQASIPRYCVCSLR